MLSMSPFCVVAARRSDDKMWRQLGVVARATPLRFRESPSGDEQLRSSPLFSN